MIAIMVAIRLNEDIFASDPNRLARIKNWLW